LGADIVQKLAKDLSGTAIQQLVTDLGADIVKKLATELEGKAIQQLVTDLGADVVKNLAKDLSGKAIQQLVADLGANSVKKLVQDLGTDVTARLFRSMDTTTFHTLNLKDSIAKVGIDDFIALVRRDGADAMIKYGAEALQKVGKADLDKAASIFATILSPSKLQKKWKHAVDFGVTTSWKAGDKAAHAKFQAALDDVVANADVVFVGPYHDSSWAAHFFKGDKLVITELSGDFISGWANASNKLAGIKNAAPPSGSNNFRVR
jgi:poly-gamma-glutamate capsule biosynthesis protein CapA/YwtB (metallophosphatase superfamily)